jgi:hypothetical protein
MITKTLVDIAIGGSRIFSGRGLRILKLGEVFCNLIAANIIWK